MGPDVRKRTVRVSMMDRDEIRGWQRRARRKISRLEGQGFATVMIDEAVCMHDLAAGRKYRSQRPMKSLNNKPPKHA